MNKKDFEVTRDFWEWAIKNPNSHKTQWDRYDEIKHLKNECAFCENFLEEGECCPLGKKLGVCHKDKNNMYDMWCNTYAPRTQKQQAAVAIYKFICEYIKEVFPMKTKEQKIFEAMSANKKVWIYDFDYKNVKSIEIDFITRVEIVHRGIHYPIKDIYFSAEEACLYAAKKEIKKLKQKIDTLNIILESDRNRIVKAFLKYKKNK